MIDINRIRNNKEEVEKALLKRMDNVDLDELSSIEDIFYGALQSKYGIVLKK